MSIECLYCKTRFELIKITKLYDSMDKKNKMYFCPNQKCNKEIALELKIKNGDNKIEN